MPDKFPEVEEQLALISRGAEAIIPEEELAKKLERSLKTGQPLKVKLGCDPSKPDLHLGHAVVLRKLGHFQQLGHEAILVIGDFTGMIGDPSGRNKTRPALTLEEARANGQSYFDQAARVLSKDRLRIVYNSEWLSLLTFADLIREAAHITVARMLERDDFSKRLAAGTPLSMHELLYPLAQAYDSVALQADVELGGTDQTFNLLMGRDLQRAHGQEPQVVVTTPLIIGTDGVEKMSKSQDNYIALTDAPDDMYGKLLSIPDKLIGSYFTHCTDLPAGELQQIDAQLAGGEVNPRDLKRRLAREVVAIYHGAPAAASAEQAFDRLFIDKGLPDDMPEYTPGDGEILLVQVLHDCGLTQSNSEGRRLIAQGGVKWDDELVTDTNLLVKRGDAGILKVGKRRFLKLVS
ncbi:MAG: tyrosine--tRNA ligase [Candidatus Marinimicrobia bacterium]|nr:tyrosine--tRNA ligase [Candidatus Neomarinimicrobiota bacterium]